MELYNDYNQLQKVVASSFKVGEVNDRIVWTN